MSRSSLATTLSALPDRRVRDVLARLHGEAARQDRTLPLRFVDQLPRLLRGRGLGWETVGRRLDDRYIAIDPDQGLFCYLTARAIRARTIVEFGTSFGVSTIYLALAVRENGGGKVFGTESVPAKVARARANVEEAGLADWVEILEGDATQTLRTVDREVDMLLCDGFPPAMLPVLKIVAPRMREGAVVVSDNVGAFWADHDDFLAWVRDPANGFQSSMLKLNEGTELSVKVGPPAR